MAITKELNGIDTEKSAPFTFDESFIETFNSMIESYDNTVDELSKVSSSINNEYGICNCSYKMRYITPSNVSTYVSNLVKAFENRLLYPNNVGDIEMFTVASVKRFIEDNNCVPFESSSIMGNSKYINPKTATLKDLLLFCENDVIPISVYSRYELSERVKSVQSDAKLIEDMHFTAVMKNIVSKIPSIITDSKTDMMRIPVIRKYLALFIEEFILFACTLNEITARSIISYCVPKVSYNLKKNDSENVVTECCLLKTNNFVIRNKIPFNCNMRDVVLQDVTPTFKDTKSALNFILKDSRSPISVLVNRYCPDDKDSNAYNDCELISQMFINKVDFGFNGRCSNTDGAWFQRNGDIRHIDPYDQADFHTDVNWLDKIAYGNNYLDCNYRNDAVGNNNMHPIVNTLDMLYRIFGGCKLKTNEELSCNIKRVANVMCSIISSYPDGRIENHELVRDILAVLGEILTRNMLRLYDNNTQVFVCDDQMNDTMIPGYLYAESFILEADDNGTPAPAVSVPNNGNNNQGKVNQMKQKISELVRRFSMWVTDQLGKFSQKFNKDHEKEVAWIKKNDQLNKQIGEALNNRSFPITITNFPVFDIPAREISNVKVNEVVNKWLNSTDPIDPKLVKKELYPGGESIANQIVNMKSEADEIAALTNYILFKQITPKATNNQAQQLNQTMWNGLLKDLLETGKLIESETRAISDDLKKACNTLQNKIRQEEVNQSNNQQQNDTQKNTDGRAAQLFNIVQGVSKTYYVTLLNVLRSKFYAVNYKLYRDIVMSYNQRNTTQTTQQPQQPQNNNNVQ